MTNAIQKTKDLKRLYVPIGTLEPSPENPNEMTPELFNMLCDNMEQVGFTDPILVVPHPEKPDMYRIIGGEHRWEVGKVLGFEEVPITLIDDDQFTQDKQKFQIVRHNIIHGKMSPQKFVRLYESLAGDYSDEVASEMFGFVDEAEFLKLLRATAKALPPELKAQFDAARSEIKTLDDLTKVLNRLFTEFGDDLPYGYMIFDFGGKESVWLRMRTQDKEDFLNLSSRCKQASRTVDGFMRVLLNALNDPTNSKLVKSILDQCPEVDLSLLTEAIPLEEKVSE